MSRLWLCLVDPHPDEAERITVEDADAGEAWLNRGLEEGYLVDWNSYANEDGSPSTGGYMVAVARDRTALTELLRTYPLLSTITVFARPLNRHGGEGFGKLRSDVTDARQRQLN